MADEESNGQKGAVRYSTRRINGIAAHFNATRYLEIGVSGGRTFFTVDVENKVAVDPRFRFDWEPRQTENVRYFQMPSDEWFIEHGRSEQFDLIFLDGLHTFEQTFRDFCNALTVAHPGTVFMIDDTVPTDVFSAWPDHREAVNFRRAQALKSGLEGRVASAWQGDVYKTIFAIHDFFPTLSYATIMGSGNPQTLVWRAGRRGFQTRFNSLEAISRLNYFDFENNVDVMNYCSESEALRLLFSGESSDGLVAAPVPSDQSLAQL